MQAYILAFAELFDYQTPIEVKAWTYVVENLAYEERQKNTGRRGKCLFESDS